MKRCDRRRGDARNQLDNFFQVRLRNVELDADLVLRGKRAEQQKLDLLDLGSLPRIFPGLFVGDELLRGLGATITLPLMESMIPSALATTIMDKDQLPDMRSSLWQRAQCLSRNASGS